MKIEVILISNIHLQAGLLGTRPFPFAELIAALPVTSKA